MAESNAFYKPTYESGLFDFSRDLYQQDALNTRKDAVSARRQAAMRPDKLSKQSPLTKGWSVHTPVFAKAWQEAMQQRANAHMNNDMAGVASAERTLDNIRLYSNASQQQGDLWKQGRTAFMGKPNKYTRESIDSFNNFADVQSTILSTDGKGNIMFEGQDIATSGANPFVAPPELSAAGDHLMEGFVKTYGRPQQAFKTITDENVMFNQNSFNSAVQEYAEDALAAGVDQEEVERFVNAASQSYPFGAYARFKEDDGGSGFTMNFGGKDYSGQYSLEQSTESLPEPTTGDAPRYSEGEAIDIIYQGDKAQPNKTYTFKNSSTGKSETEELKVTRVFKGNDGKIYAYGTGYSGKPYSDEDGVYTNRERGEVTFEVTEQNRNQVESLLPKDEKGNKLTLAELFNLTQGNQSSENGGGEFDDL